MMETGDDCILVARVGRLVTRVFPVHFVLPDGDCEDAEAREAVGQSLDHNVVSRRARLLGVRHLSHDDTRRPVIPGVLGWIRRRVESGRPETGSSASTL